MLLTHSSPASAAHCIPTDEAKLVAARTTADGDTSLPKRNYSTAFSSSSDRSWQALGLGLRALTPTEASEYQKPGAE
ncbi:MAG: hypothetical protein WA804_01130 [Terriglobales bacterium]